MVEIDVAIAIIALIDIAIAALIIDLKRSGDI